LSEADKLMKLLELHEAGLLSDQELAEARKQVIANIVDADAPAAVSDDSIDQTPQRGEWEPIQPPAGVDSTAVPIGDGTFRRWCVRCGRLTMFMPTGMGLLSGAMTRVGGCQTCGHTMFLLEAGFEKRVVFDPLGLGRKRGPVRELPTCPTCKSTLVQPLSGKGSFFRVGPVGRLKLPKQFRCENCGYSW